MTTELSFTTTARVTQCEHHDQESIKDAYWVIAEVMEFVREHNERNTTGQRFVLGELFKSANPCSADVDEDTARRVKKYIEVAKQNEPGFQPHLWTIWDTHIDRPILIGVIGCMAGIDYYTHLFFVVHREHRRKGILKKLMKSIEDWVQENTSIRYHHVTTSKENTMLQEALKCMGYIVVGTIQGKKREMMTLIKPSNMS